MSYVLKSVQVKSSDPLQHQITSATRYPDIKMMRIKRVFSPYSSSENPHVTISFSYVNEISSVPELSLIEWSSGETKSKLCVGTVKVRLVIEDYSAVEYMGDQEQSCSLVEEILSEACE